MFQVWFTQWKDSRPVESGPLKWEEFKEVFLERYFSREKREVKIEEFINLRQGGISVEDYSLKFMFSSKYAPSLVSTPRDEISMFFTGVSDIVKEECHTTTLNGDMIIYRIMMYAQSIVVSKLGRRSRAAKREEPRSNFNLSLKRGLQIKMVLVLQILTMREVVVPKWLILLVLLVGKRTLESL